MRSVYVISDLHLGGAYADPPVPGERGFRLCTHSNAIADFIGSLIGKIGEKTPVELVLNGDTVDFLAESDETPDSWSPFTSNPERAVSQFKKIVKRDQKIFDRLKEFIAKGGRLTILLGNHDIELSLPLVRSELRKTLGVNTGNAFNFLYDGEAYIVGDALIEHGNRYDAWNQVDYDALRRNRSFQSRRQKVPEKYNFSPPPGSTMVASLMNPIKRHYPFVDLLKPEEAATVPILLALEPGYRTLLGSLAMLAYRTRSHGLEAAALPKSEGDISSDLGMRGVEYGEDIASEGDFEKVQFDEDLAAQAPPPPAPPNDSQTAENLALKRAVKQALGAETERFFQEIDGALAAGDPSRQFGDDIASGTIDTILGFAALLSGKGSQSYEKRLPALFRAMRGMQTEDTFNENKETAAEYLNAARDLADGGFRYVVFGHTHQAKHVDLGNGCFYLNSGTWADVLKFPEAILHAATYEEALEGLREFVTKMKLGDFSSWSIFRPTYVRFELDDNDRITEAALETFVEMGSQGA